MKTTLLLLVLLLNLLGIGCKPLTRAAIQASQSAFLSQFSLQKAIADTVTPGLDCSKFGAGSGMGGSAGGIGSGRVSHSQTYTIYCEISGAGQFKESEFMRSLKSRIEKQIQTAGGKTLGSGTLVHNGLGVDYAEGKIQGKVEVSGQRQERYYIVTSKIDESNK